MRLLSVIKRNGGQRHLRVRLTLTKGRARASRIITAVGLIGWLPYPDIQT